MRDYTKLSPQFWISPQGKAIRQLGPIVRLTALYLLSCPQTTMLGIYYLPLPYLAYELDTPLEGASQALEKLCQLQFCTYDKAMEYVWVHEMAYSQVGPLKATDNRVKQICDMYQALPELPFLKDFYHQYQGILHLQPRGLLSPSQGLRKVSLSQEQEQNQEQGQEQEQKQDHEQEAFKHVVVADEDQPSSVDDEYNSNSTTLKNPSLYQFSDGKQSETLFLDEEKTNLAIPLHNGSAFIPSPTQIHHWQTLYPAIDVKQELRQIRAWNEANPTERKPRTQILRHINAWLAKEQRVSRRQQAPPIFSKASLAARGLSPTLAHNLQVGEAWLKNSMKSENVKQPETDHATK